MQAAVVATVCAAIFLPLLGSSGFAQTEGHRAIPGWTMADTGDWMRMELFGQPYLTKPPGLPILIGASAHLLGESEFSARLPSAICMTLGAMLSLVFARRWFGPEWGLPAGLAHALMPWFWSPARSAEIESLHQLGAQAACFSALTLLIGAARGVRAGALVLLGAAGVFVMVMAKGPVAFPALLAVLIAAPIVGRQRDSESGRAAVAQWHILADWRLAVMLVAGAAAALAALMPFGPPSWLTSTAGAEVGGQLWRLDRLGQIAALPVAAFIAAMPASLALVFPWGPDARLEGRIGPDADARRAHDFARALALAWAVTVVAYMLLGTGNHRYVMPAAVFVPLLVGYVVRGVCIVPDGFLPLRRKIARLMLLGRGWAWAALLLIAAAAWVPLSERQRESRSGRDAGRRLAETLPDGAVVFADSLIEAVPETLLYAQQAAAQQGRKIDVKWERRLAASNQLEFEPPTVLVLRHDAVIDERTCVAEALARRLVAPIHADAVRDYAFTAYRGTNAAAED